VYCHWSDVEPLIAERDALKAELSEANGNLSCERMSDKPKLSDQFIEYCVEATGEGDTVRYMAKEIKTLRTSLEAATKELEVFTTDIPSKHVLNFAADLLAKFTSEYAYEAETWIIRIAARGSE
jgi:hypothetical protein